MEHGQQLSRLPVSAEVIIMAASQHKPTWQISGDQELGLRVGIFQCRRPALAGPGAKPAQVRFELARDVVVTVSARLDNEARTGVFHFQNGRLRKPPAVVVLEARAWKPLAQQTLLPRRKALEIGGHARMLHSETGTKSGDVGVIALFVPPSEHAHRPQ